MNPQSHPTTETRAVVWPNVLQRMEAKIGKQSVEIWLKNTLLVRLDEADCEIGVPNQYIQEWIRQRLATPLRQCITEETGLRPKLSVTINGHLFRKIREARPPVEPEPAPRVETPKSSVRARAQRQQIFRLNPKYTLERFVPGPSNELAFNTAMEVVTDPQHRYNPLFIHGGCGLGKTHLLQGIAQALLSRDPRLDVLYVTSDYFTNLFVTALQAKQMDAFQARIRDLDVLIIDDVHGLARRAATQEEFLQTFSELQVANKQVVLASDAHPKHIDRLKDEIVSRCLCGMVAKIAPPSFETRVEVIERKLAEQRQTLPRDVVEFVARKITRNIRELEGALVRLAAFNSLLNEPLTLPTVRQALADIMEIGDTHLTLSDIENAVIGRLNVSSDELHGSSRRAPIVFARHVVMYLARKLTDASLNEIGRFFNKNHATVLFSERKVTDLIAQDADIRATVRKLQRDLQDS